MTLLRWFAETTVIAGVLAVIVWGVCRCLGARLGPGARHLLWLVVLAKLLTPPLFSWRLPAPRLAEIASTPAPTTSAPAAAPPATPTIPAARDDFDEDWSALDHRPIRQRPAPFAPIPISTSAVAPSHPAPIDMPPPLGKPRVVAVPKVSTSKPWNWDRIGSILIGIWGFGAVIEIARQSRRIMIFRRLVAEAKPAPDWLLEEIAGTAATMKLTPPPALTLSNLPGPMIWCWGRPVLLIPDRLPGALDRSKWSGVLIHELAHLKRGDHWVARLDLIAGAIWWFSPVYRWTRSRLRAESELACDAWVVELGPEAESRRAYAEALVDVCEHISISASKFALGFGSGSGVEAMEGRLTMILREVKPNPKAGRWAFAAVAMGLLALPGWSAEPQKPEPARPADPEPPPARRSEEVRKSRAPARPPAVSPPAAKSEKLAPPGIDDPLPTIPPPRRTEPSEPRPPKADATPAKPPVSTPAPSDPAPPTAETTRSLPAPAPPPIGEDHRTLRSRVVVFKETRDTEQTAGSRGIGESVDRRKVEVSVAELARSIGSDSPRIFMDQMSIVPAQASGAATRIIRQVGDVEGGDQVAVVYDVSGGGARVIGPIDPATLMSRYRIGNARFLTVDAVAAWLCFRFPKDTSVRDGAFSEEFGREEIVDGQRTSVSTLSLRFGFNGSLKIQRRLSTERGDSRPVRVEIRFDTGERSPAAHEPNQKRTQHVRARFANYMETPEGPLPGRIDVIEDFLDPSGRLLSRSRYRVLIENVRVDSAPVDNLVRASLEARSDGFDEEGDGPAQTMISQLGRGSNARPMPKLDESLAARLIEASRANPFGPVTSVLVEQTAAAVDRVGLAASPAGARRSTPVPSERTVPAPASPAAADPFGPVPATPRPSLAPAVSDNPFAPPPPASVPVADLAGLRPPVALSPTDALPSTTLKPPALDNPPPSPTVSRPRGPVDPLAPVAADVASASIAPPVAATVPNTSDLDPASGATTPAPTAADPALRSTPTLPSRRSVPSNLPAPSPAPAVSTIPAPSSRAPESVSIPRANPSARPGVRDPLLAPSEDSRRTESEEIAEAAESPFDSGRVSLDTLRDQIELARLRVPSRTTAVESAQLRLQVATESLAQQQKLRERGFIPSSTVSEKEAAVSEARERLESKKAELEEAKLLLTQSQRRLERESKRLDRQIADVRARVERVRRHAKRVDDPILLRWQRELDELLELKGQDPAAAPRR